MIGLILGNIMVVLGVFSIIKGKVPLIKRYNGVKKGSCAGVIYYKLGGMVLRKYQVETTEDMEKLDFEWCLRQVLKLAV